MNLRCAFCQTPFAIGRHEMLAALQHLETENLTHYDAHCPRCQRATRVQKQKLELAFPNWRDALHELEQQAATAPEPALPIAPAQKAESMPAHAKHHRSRAGAKAKEAVAAAVAAKTASKGKRESATKKKSK